MDDLAVSKCCGRLNVGFVEPRRKDGDSNKLNRSQETHGVAPGRRRTKLNVGFAEPVAKTVEKDQQAESDICKGFDGSTWL